MALLSIFSIVVVVVAVVSLASLQLRLIRSSWALFIITTFVIVMTSAGHLNPRPEICLGMHSSYIEKEDILFDMFLSRFCTSFSSSFLMSSRTNELYTLAYVVGVNLLVAFLGGSL